MSESLESHSDPGKENKMKLRVLLIILALTMMFFSCGKKKSSPTGPDVGYNLTDLVGTWTGEGENSSNTVSLDLSVDSGGKVSGSGVSSQWSIDSNGKVTGGGSFSFLAGSRLVVAAAGWSLQIDSNKTGLSGTFNVAYSTLHDMAVTLTKQ